MLQRLEILDDFASEGCPPMQLVTQSSLRDRGELVAQSDGIGQPAAALLEHYGCDRLNRPRLITVIYSHRWLRPWWKGPCHGDVPCCACQQRCGVEPAGWTGTQPCGYPDDYANSATSLVAFGEWL